MMSRNKENIPFASHQDLNNALSSPKQLHSDEFFTDSLLDATRVSSQIPTPVAPKPSLNKARRARNSRQTRNAQRPSHRSSASESKIPQSQNKQTAPSTPLKTGNAKGAARLRTHSLTTPPESNGDLYLPSPYSTISSPPPQDLTDTYRQIEDEDLLAQTERDLSDSNSPSEAEEESPPFKLTRRSMSDGPLQSLSPFAHSSRASTPTRNSREKIKDHRLNDRTEALSEASGLSFLKDMTDQALASKLTPHVSESAKDRARLREVWSGKKLKAFSRAGLSVPGQVDLSNASAIPIRQLKAFSKAEKLASKAALNGDQETGLGNGLLPGDSRPDSQPSDYDTDHAINQVTTSLPINSRLDRRFFHSNHGFPDPRNVLSEQNLERQNRGTVASSIPLRSQSSAPSLKSDQSHAYGQTLGRNNHASRLPQFRKSTQAETKQSPADSSQVDWVEAAADIAMPSVEKDLSPEKESSAPTPLTKQVSPGKNRRWDNDFTGQSFQISESPPVRQKPQIQEHQREKEIEGIAKKAVTTSRLSEIRERESQENLRSVSRSPASRSASQSRLPELKRVTSLTNGSDDHQDEGEAVPNTPVVIFRSSSNSSSEKLSRSTTGERPQVDRSKSHDQLQRLARAVSSTPRTSPAPEGDFKKAEMNQSTSAAIPSTETAQVAEGHVESKMTSLTDAAMPVSQTPRVAGAWTDTILPDTVKTVKHQSKYAQTPHVSAGGWIDTPAPPEQRGSSGNISTIAEVPEELTTGIVKDSANSGTIKIELTDEKDAPQDSQPQLPSEQQKSALTSILDQQKLRLAAQDDIPASREDTLNLGQDTIESLQGLLALDENDLTTLSRISLLENDTRPLGEAQAESELLERLGVKLDRLRSNIHDARKGISKLEHQVSQPVDKSLVPSPQQLLSDTVCSICNQQTFLPHVHHITPTSSSKLFPHSSLTISLPIPLLFHPRGPGQRIPRPTTLGYLTMTVWLWYIVESTMCELYCQPAYTDFYIWPEQREPEFPFVLPTMLYRWSRFENITSVFPIAGMVIWVWTLIKTTVRAMWRILSMCMGWSDGFASDGHAPGAGGHTVVKQVIETATDLAATATAGMDWSMNDDEYI